jgi:hypothetical protein
MSPSASMDLLWLYNQLGVYYALDSVNSVFSSLFLVLQI